MNCGVISIAREVVVVFVFVFVFVIVFVFVVAPDRARPRPSTDSRAEISETFDPSVGAHGTGGSDVHGIVVVGLTVTRHL